MKKLLAIIFILSIVITGIFTKNYLNNKKGGEKIMNDNNEEDIVLNRYKEMLTAMVDKDENVLNEVIKKRTTFTHMSGKTQTKEEYIADIISRRLDYKSYTIEHPEVTIEGNKAILKARVSLTANAYGAYGTYPFNVTAYFEKINGKWLYSNAYNGF